MAAVLSLEQAARGADSLRLLKQAAHGPVSERQRLYGEAVLLNLPVAESIARRYAGRGVPLEDLLQVAALALTKAVQRFDPDRGHDLLSYAVPTITGEVKRHFRDHGWTIRPPRGIQELRQRIGPAVEELSQRGHRAPRPSEIAKHLGVAVDKVWEALASDGCYAPAPLRERGSDNGTEPSAAALGEPDAGMLRAEAIAVLMPLCARLSPRERRLLDLRFFRGCTQSQIAVEFGLSQMQISRLLRDLLTRMRRQLESPRDTAVSSSSGPAGPGRGGR